VVPRPFARIAGERAGAADRGERELRGKVGRECAAELPPLDRVEVARKVRPVVAVVVEVPVYTAIADVEWSGRAEPEQRREAYLAHPPRRVERSRKRDTVPSVEQAA